jgi:hypothetical protein
LGALGYTVAGVPRQQFPHRAVGSRAISRQIAHAPRLAGVNECREAEFVREMEGIVDCFVPVADID